MAPFSIEEDVDVFEQVSMGDGIVKPVAMVSQLGLEQMKERLSHGVVPAVALATHALYKSTLGHPLEEVAARVLDATIRMDDQAWPRSASSHGLTPSRQHDGVVQSRAQNPADHASRIEVDEDRRIQQPGPTRR